MNNAEIERLSDSDEDYLELNDEQFLTRMELQSTGGTFHRIVTTCRVIRVSIKRSHSKKLMFDEYQSSLSISSGIVSDFPIRFDSTCDMMELIPKNKTVLERLHEKERRDENVCP